jgi:molecular chaperone DnaK (HSP70)
MDKVPTILAYDPNGSRLLSWGAQVQLDARDQKLARLFKLCLHPSHVPPTDTAPTCQEAMIYFEHYLTRLYHHLMQVFQSDFPHWNDKYVEFIFSTPTTWTDPRQINIIQEAIRSAGWGSQHKHDLRMGATEAEAAAMHASLTLQGFQEDEVIMVCDAGGGTTDVNILKIVNATSAGMTMRPLTTVEGEDIGSAHIDFAVSGDNSSFELCRCTPADTLEL